MLSLIEMLNLRIIVFSSRNILLASSLLIGVSAILASIFAINSDRWIHVFRSIPEEAEVVYARANLSPTFRDVDTETQRNVSEEHHQGSWSRKGTGALHFTCDCQEEHGTTSVHCGIPVAERGSHYADEAYGGLWRVCHVYHCLNGSMGAVVRRQCWAPNDPAFKRRPLCHVAVAVLAISAEAHKTLVIYSLASAILVCGVTLGVVGSFSGSCFLILGAFLDTTAGLLQFLALFLYAIVVNDEVKSVSDDSQVQLGYNYDWGSIHAVIAFAGTNLAAILAAYSYRGHQSNQKKASCRRLEASMPLAEAYQHS